MPVSFSSNHYCCGFVPIKTGVSLITIFGILNKLSGFYGILSFSFEDRVATMTYVYSLVAIAIFAQGLYALHKDSVRIFRWYTMFFWFDCFISVISTTWFAVAWYVYTDHSLPEIENDPAKKAEYDRLFDMEKRVSIAFLIILRLVHFYFASVVTRYYKSLNKVSGYSKLNESIDLEDAMSGRPAEYVPKQALD